MVGKIVVMPIVGIVQIELRASLEEMLTDSLTRVGYDVRQFEHKADLQGASQLLVPGIGVWGTPELERILAEARNQGVPTVLWQMETLPPPDLPRSLTLQVLFRETPYKSRHLNRVVDKIALRRLSRLCQALPWWADGMETEISRLGLPVREARYIRKLHRNGLLDLVLVSLETRLKFLQSVGVESTFMPFGYHPTWGYPLPGINKDIDVLYIGSPTPRRLLLLKQIDIRLRAAGFGLTLVERDCYGEERNQMINRSKLFLQLRNYPWELPRLRMMMAMGCKTLLVTEEFHDTAPFVSGEHFLMAPLNELPGTMIKYLHDEQARTIITDRSYQMVSGELELGRVLLKAMA